MAILVASDSIRDLGIYLIFDCTQDALARNFLPNNDDDVVIVPYTRSHTLNLGRTHVFRMLSVLTAQRMKIPLVQWAHDKSF